MNRNYLSYGSSIPGLILIILTTSAQTQNISRNAIHVESDQVLVPVFVLDNRQAYIAQHTDPKLAASDLRPWLNVAIRDIDINEFEVFEDGRKQEIQKVTLEGPFVSEVRDNKGLHYEYLGTGSGRWIYPDIPKDGQVHAVIAWPDYLLAYTPPESPEGSCHKVQVRLKNHLDAEVFALARYCKTKRSTLDPLSETKFGKKLETDLASGKTGRISLDLATSVLFAAVNDARVQITVGFLPKNLNYSLVDQLHETIGLLAKVYSSDGTLVASFSSFDCCDLASEMSPGFTTNMAPDDDVNMLYSPGGYQTQFVLPPGEYDLQLVLSDGEKFGRAETRLTVERHDLDHFAVSDIALAKRFRQASTAREDSSLKTPESYVPLISKGVEITPTADTRFHKGDIFYFYFEINEPAHTEWPKPIVEANLRIIDAKTGSIVKASEPLDAASYVIPGNPIIPIGAGTDISKLPPGSYRLEVQATDSTGQSTPWHSASFTIE